MSDIELVIKISKEDYSIITSDLYNTLSAEMKDWGLEAIRNGIRLPKGHGRLIDESAITEVYTCETEFKDVNGMKIYPRIDIIGTNAPTLIAGDSVRNNYEK